MTSDTETISASTAASGSNPATPAAAPVPASTGAIAVGSVRGRAPSTHSPTVATPREPSGPPRLAGRHRRGALDEGRRHVAVGAGAQPEVAGALAAGDVTAR